MPEKFSHETLAEFHDLPVGFPLRIKIRASFSTPQRKRGQAVFEYLFESQEFKDAKVNTGVEP